MSRSSTARACVHTKRVDAGKHLRSLLSRQLAATPPETTGEPGPIGRLGGLDVLGQTITAIQHEIRISVPDAEIELRSTGPEWGDVDPAGLIQRLEGRIQRLPKTVDQLRADALAATDEANQAETRLAQPWEQSERLKGLRRRQQELDEALTETLARPEAATAPATDVAHLRQQLDRPRPTAPGAGMSR